MPIVVFKNIRFYFIISVLFFVEITLLPAQTYYKTLSDSSIKHELTITPIIGYGELKFLEGPLGGSIDYSNAHFLTRSPILGCSINYLVTENACIGLSAEYQTIPFSAMYIRQVYYYNNISNPYKYTTSPELEASFNYFLDNDNINIGAVVSYQTMQCTPTTQQSFFPTAIQFSYVDIGIPLLYDFQSKDNNPLHFFIGMRGDLTIWKEKDNKSNNRTDSTYASIVITPGEDIRRPNYLEFSLLFHGGIRYSFSPSIRMQLDVGFGFNTPYYSELGVIFRLNKWLNTK
ncbi:MAG: outer membrane beta-barrel protein [Bacteroidia bacterium]